MANEFPFPTERVFDGAHGKLIDADGLVIQEVAELTTSLDQEFKDIKVAGTRWTAHKLIGVKGTGSMKLLRVSAALRLKIITPMLNGTPYVTQLIAEVGNDEGAVERWLLQNVKFTGKIDLVKFIRQDEVEDDLEFSFLGCRQL